MIEPRKGMRISLGSPPVRVAWKNLVLSFLDSE
jgi:hypothetical protein